jgi:iron complex outermembrane receptor protein
MKSLIRLVLLAGAAALPITALAQAPATDLTTATLEELMAIRVTSASRKSQAAEDVPAAVYVITRQDIRRSGLVTLPEILRLAPGVQVAQVNASRWAISIRGFNYLYSNKLLVLVDGRSVYTRTFSGVFWDMQDVMVADIERIEVIRGPGGAVWGANAVNGVINVITRASRDTQGLALDASVGTLALGRAGVRYGGRLGAASYRVFSQWSGYGDASQVAATPFDDRWRSLTNGVRADWSRGGDAILAQSHFTANTTRPGWLVLTSAAPGLAPVTDGIATASEVSVLGRWTRTRDTGGVLQVQAFHTSMRRDEIIAALREQTSDVDAQYETALGNRHGLVFGGGYRYVGFSVDNTFTMSLDPRPARTFSTFLQDEIALRPDLALTLGSKLEHDTFGGWGLLPSARIMWELTPSQHLWGAVSRTRRTPALTERYSRVNVGVAEGPGLPVAFGYTGNPDYRSEVLVQTEAGFRTSIGPDATLDATVFSGAYDGLPTIEPLPPVVSLTPPPAHLQVGGTFANLLSARSSGVELSGQWNPVAPWQLEASYSFLHVTARVDPTSLDPGKAATDGSAPSHQWLLRSTASLRPGVQLGASVARVGALDQLRIPAYTRVDARLEVRLSRHLTAAAVGQNLTGDAHREFSSDILFLSSGVPRSARLDLRWEF